MGREKMRLYTSKYRDYSLNTIVDELKQIDGIESIILVGSGAVGFTDDLSDLDFTIVLNNEEDLSSIMRRVKDFIFSKFDCMNILEVDVRGLQVYILKNFLEIDMGYVKLENLSAFRDRWKVLYDKTGKADLIMKETWKVNKNNYGKKEFIDINQRCFEISQDIWHYIMHSIVAVNRNDYWRAIGELDIVRNTLIELLGYKYSLETKRYRNVDKFPSEIKEKLQRTIPIQFDVKTFRNIIIELTELIYGELYLHLSKEKFNVTVQDIKEYCNDILES